MNFNNNTSNIMEGFYIYLDSHNKTKSTDRYIKIVRRFHNYVGKTYSDVRQSDLQDYLEFLVKNENIKYTSLRHHIVGINEFYKFLSLIGFVDKNPFDKDEFKKLSVIKENQINYSKFAL